MLLGDIELALLLAGPLLVEGGRGEDEAQFVNLLQLIAQDLVGIDGESRSSDSHAAISGEL